MILHKCKICGGDLIPVPGSVIATCENCGTKQPFPTGEDPRKLKLFAHANRLRLACEFDKAAGIYEAIIADYPEEAEAYWGLVLCKYGIEYVTDPKTGRKTPTCRRSSFSSVLEDPDLEQALCYADTLAGQLYRKEAQKIENLRKQIVSISTRASAYDIFLCYKETDAQGNRTLDSAMAQEVYNALTERGYRVFFSRITLEEQLGQNYEPYIFSALHSARVMLVFGTSYENFDAVWVKNEWQRFLSLISQGEQKTLIPCYRLEDLADLPQEFTRLQAQDMGKIGAVQDLLRGIDKLFGTDTPVSAFRSTGTQEKSVSRKSLFLKKALPLGFVLAAALLVFLNTGKEQPIETEPAVTLAVEEPQTETTLETLPVITDPEYLEAEQLLAEGKKYEAAVAFYAIRDKYDARDRSMAIWSQIVQWDTIYAGGQQSLAIKNDGTVLYTGIEIDNLESLSSWKDIVDLGVGVDYCVGLRKNGTVAATGWNLYGQCEVSDWYDIVDITTGYAHTVGLRADGTVLAVGNNQSGQCDISHWTDIIAVSASNEQTIGLKKDGTVVAAGFNDDGQCNVSDWTDITKIDAAWNHTVGLKSDGTAVATGWNYYQACDVSQWTDLTDISAESHTVGIRSDGSVVVAGSGRPQYPYCAAAEWTSDLIAVSTGSNFTLGLRSNGTALATGSNEYGACEVSTWNDIRLPNKRG